MILDGPPLVRRELAAALNPGIPVGVVVKLSEMAAGGRSRRATRTVEMCLAQDLIAEAEDLGRERLDVLIDSGRLVDEDSESKPRKLSEGALPPRVVEIDARLEAIYDEMREHTGTLLLRAEPAGAWRRWVDENPARVDDRDEDGRPVFNTIDVDVARGYCDASALLGRLRDFAESWDDEPITDEGWAYLLDNAAPGDIKEACRKVVDLHEAGGSTAPKSRKPSSGMPEGVSV